MTTSVLTPPNGDMPTLLTTTVDKPDDTTWQQPLPLSSTQPDDIPYPIDALPSCVGNAVTAYHTYGQQPLSLIACSALSNISLACQSHANVARDRFLVSPVSMYFLVVAASGERKSGCDTLFSQAIRRWESRSREHLAPHVMLAKSLHQTWRAERAGLLNQIKRCSTQSDESDLLKQDYLALSEQEPLIPLLPHLFFEDTTAEGLATHLAQGWASASLASDEGGLILGSSAMQGNATKFIALLNRLWDGKPFTTHRKTADSFVLENRRLTVSIMLQPFLLSQLLAQGNSIHRQSGFLARALLTYPTSTMGTRHYKEPPTEALTALTPFHDTITACLEASTTLDKRGCYDLPVLQFSTAAKAHWVKFFNALETGLIQHHRWRSVTDFAAKAAENVARLAALFHLFAGKQSDIQINDVESAIEIIQWHLYETKRLLGTAIQTEQELDAAKLLRWLRRKSFADISLRKLQQFSPVREKKRLKQALSLLIESHYLREGNNEDGSGVFRLNPKILP